MAISATHYRLMRRLQPLLPRGGSLLEIGEANWYGDVEPDFPWPSDVEPEYPVSVLSGDKLFAIAKAFYADLFAPSRILSVDANGSENALRLDLNKPLPPLGLFDVVINHGTAEHVFNIAQVFASMHTACKVGGLMVHESPFTGWIEHGFYCLQPTLFYDLAASNGYEIVLVAVEEIRSQTIIEIASRDDFAGQTFPDNSMLFVALRKQSAEPFKLPWQGYYAQTLSEAGAKAWEEMR